MSSGSKSSSGSSQSSRISLSDLQRTAERLQREQRCVAMRKTDFYAWHSFTKFTEPTIRSYLSAVRAILKEDGIILNEKSPALLRLIADELDDYFLEKKNQPYLNILYKTILLTGYYGMMRIGEMTKTDGDHTLKFRDVHIGSKLEKVSLLFRSSKTHTRNQKLQVVKILSNADTSTVVVI